MTSSVRAWLGAPFKSAPFNAFASTSSVAVSAAAAEKNANRKKVVILGGGRLGESLLSLELDVVGVFDVDPTKFGKPMSNGITIESADFLRTCVVRHKVVRGIIAVPGPHAQEAADRLVEAGISAIISYAPKDVVVPPGCRCERVDPTRFFSTMTAVPPQPRVSTPLSEMLTWPAEASGATAAAIHRSAPLGGSAVGVASRAAVGNMLGCMVPSWNPLLENPPANAGSTVKLVDCVATQHVSSFGNSLALALPLLGTEAATTQRLVAGMRADPPPPVAENRTDPPPTTSLWEELSTDPHADGGDGTEPSFFCYLITERARERLRAEMLACGATGSMKSTPTSPETAATTQTNDAYLAMYS